MKKKNNTTKLELKKNIESEMSALEKEIDILKLNNNKLKRNLKIEKQKNNSKKQS